MKQGYQPKSCNLKNIVPPSVSTNVKPKKEGYTWEDLDKAWWEGFDTCKAKSGEANIKLNDELEKLKKQLEELPDKWCRNKDDYCPHLAKLEKENAELNERICKVAQNIFDNWCKGDDPCPHLKKRDEQLAKAKEIIREFMKYEITEYDGSLEIHFEELKKQAKQFLKGDGCPDCLCEDCTKEDCGIKKLGLVEVEK